MGVASASRRVDTGIEKRKPVESDLQSAIEPERHGNVFDSKLLVADERLRCAAC